MAYSKARRVREQKSLAKREKRMIVVESISAQGPAVEMALPTTETPMVERALLKLIVSLDSRRELYPEAHLYAEQREMREKRAAFHRLVPTLLYRAAQVIPGAVPSAQ